MFTMAELFGARHRVTAVSLAKEIAGLVATGFGPIMLRQLLRL